jgi:hypothetical protein
LQSIPRDFDLALNYSNDVADVRSYANEHIDINENQYSEIEESNSSAFFLSKIYEDDDASLSSLKQASDPNSLCSIRSLFVANTNRILLSADYCQLELRIITNLCKDEGLVSIFNNVEYDIFNLLASKWLDLPINEIDDIKRQNVKKVC